MITIKDVSESELTDFFINDPKLAYLGLPDNDLVNLFYHHKYVPNSISFYKGVFEDDRLICPFKIEFFTETTANLHLYLCSDLHKTGKIKEVEKEIRRWFLEETYFQKVLIMAPETCDHVHGTAEYFGFVVEGRLTKAVRWRKELVDVIIYSDNIREDK